MSEQQSTHALQAIPVGGVAVLSLVSMLSFAATTWDSQSKQIPRLNACELFNDADAKALFGPSVQSGEREAIGQLSERPTVAGEVSICSYYRVNSAVPAVVIATRKSYSQAFAYAAMMNTVADQPAVVTKAKDRSPSSRPGGELTEMNFVVSNIWIAIRTHGEPDADKVLAVANQVVSRASVGKEM